MRAILLMVLCLPAWAAVAVNNAGTMSQTATTGITFAFTVTAGSNVVLIVSLAYDGASAAITSVTYNSVAMSSCPAAAAGNNSHAQIWYLANPAQGVADNVVVTGNANVAEIYYGAVSFTGADQTNPIRSGTCNTATGTSLHPAVTVTSNANDMTTTVVEGGTSASNSGTNQTLISNANGGSRSGGYDRENCVSGSCGTSVTHTWTLSVSDTWAIAGASVCAVNTSCAGAATRGLFEAAGLDGITSGGAFFANPLTFADLWAVIPVWIWRRRLASARKVVYAQFGIVDRPVFVRPGLADPAYLRAGGGAVRPTLAAAVSARALEVLE